jgi:hypothetical protein
VKAIELGLLPRGGESAERGYAEAAVD